MAKEFNDSQEKEFDDEVYEDDFYDSEEELKDEHDNELDDDDESGDVEVKIHISFACEDCDYRWEDVIVKIKGTLDAQDNEIEANCPMCGSVNVTQI